MLGGIGVHFTGAKADPTRLQQPSQSSQQESLNEQALELRQERLAEGRQRFRVETAGDEAEGGDGIPPPYTKCAGKLVS